MENNNSIDITSLLLQALSLQILFKDYNNSDLMNELQHQNRDYLDNMYEHLYGIEGTVGEVSGMFPDNTLLITMRGHITCSKPTNNGPAIYDTFDCRNREVEDVWLVK